MNPTTNPTVHTLDLTRLYREIQRLRDGDTHDYPHDVEPEVVEAVYHLTESQPDVHAVELVWFDARDGSPPRESVQVTPR